MIEEVKIKKRTKEEIFVEIMKNVFYILLLAFVGIIVRYYIYPLL